MTKVAALLILGPLGLVELVLRVVLVLALVCSLIGVVIFVFDYDADRDSSRWVEPYTWKLLDAAIREW